MSSILTTEMVERAARVLVSTFNTLGAMEVLSYLDVEWNKNFRRKMGVATFRYNSYKNTKSAEIVFSAALWPHAPSDKDRDQTVIHEVCHIVDYWKMTKDSNYPRLGGHKEPWKKLMRQCGVDPERCYTWKRPDELKNKQRERYQIKCWSCQKVFTCTIIVVRRILSGEREYHCSLCGITLRATDIKTL